MTLLKFISLTSVASLLAACGGTGDVGGVLITGDQYGAGLANHSEKLTEVLNPTEVSKETLPSTRSLRWPDDFPASLNGGLTETVIVSGLDKHSAYDFDVTLPDGMSTEDTTLFILELGIDGESGSPVCYGDPDCTGTVSTTEVSMQLVGAEKGLASIAIELSSETALLNEGAATDPVILDLASQSVRHTGTVGRTRTAQNQLLRGKSFYQTANMSIGDRYRIWLPDASDEVVLSIEDASASCISHFSNTSECVFTAQVGAVDFTVSGDPAFFGARYVVEVEQLSAAENYEGSLNNPLTLDVSDTEKRYHLGRTDRYGSYYKLQALDTERSYRLLLTGNTAPVRLKLYSPLSNIPDYILQCAPIDDENLFGEQYCIVDNAELSHFTIESVDENARYLLSIEAGVKNESSSLSPIVLPVSDGKLLHTAAVTTESYFELQGLTAGVQYVLQINAPSSLPLFELLSADGGVIECVFASDSHCTFSAADTRVVLKVSDNGSGFGERFVVSLLPTDPDNPVQPTPFAEDLSLSAGSFPYAGTVNDAFSNYTVTGLAVDQHYVVTISEVSEQMSFAAWPNTESEIRCNIVSNAETTGCLVRAGSDGQLRIRVGGNRGGQFRIKLTDAFDLPGDYLSQDTPLEIADNSVAGAVSSLEIADVQIVDIVEVLLLIDHGYSNDLLIRLEAPDGRMITLADHIPGTSFGGTVYSDLAAIPYLSESGYRSHVATYYRPKEPLHNLAGLSGAGTWKLHVADDIYSNRTDALGGSLLVWGLNFKSITDRQSE